MEDYAYASLISVLGRESVIDYPWKPELHYHDLSREQQDYLYRHPRTFSGYHKSGGPCVFHNLNGLFRPGAPLKELYDAVIIGAHRVDSCTVFNILKDMRSPLPPVILLDGEEHYDNPWEAESSFDVQKSVDWIFKQVYLKGSSWDRVSVLPCPCQFDLYDLFGIPDYPSKYPGKIVFFIGDSSGPNEGKLRKDCCEAIRKSGLPFFGGAVNMKLLYYPDYLKNIRACQINLAMGGAVYSTRRYWEIPAVGGFMLAERPYVNQGPHDFKEGVHCDFFSSPEECVDKSRYWFDHPEEAHNIAVAGNEHAKKYHSLASRGEIIIEKIKELNK